MTEKFRADQEFARQLDARDPLAKFRFRFHIPKSTIYLDGNSLGLLSRDSEEALLRVLDEWKRLGIRGWLEAENPWFYYAESLGAQAAKLVGARADEVVATGTTTVNIHALTSTFYKPVGKRKNILADALNFPTDLYALRSHLRLRGFSEEGLVLAPSKDGRMLDEDQIVDMMTDEAALVHLASVLYKSGQLLDMPYLIREAHKRGIAIGFDCSHSVGNIPHRFDEWGLDYAMWCSYKYMSSGPGSAAFLYVNKSHFDREPLLAGWFGYVKEKQFDLRIEFEHQKSAGGWQISSPAMLSAAPIEGALKITNEAGIENIHEKSKRITSYLIYLVDELLSKEPYNFGVGTPRDPERRGGHVALEHDEAWRITEALKARGVVADHRPPNTIRVAPIALYNTYHEVWLVVDHLRQIIERREYERFRKERKSDHLTAGGSS